MLKSECFMFIFAYRTRLLKMLEYSNSENFQTDRDELDRSDRDELVGFSGHWYPNIRFKNKLF